MQGFLKVALLVVCFMHAEGSGVSRIIGGQNIPISSVPWQVSLRLDGSHICGGSFISSDWVITAAHCVDGQSIGSLSIGYGDELKSSHSVVGIASITMHPNYNANASAGYPYDYAVVQLSSSVSLNGNTAAAIPLAVDDYPLTDCAITGWGCTALFVGLICTSRPDALKGTMINKITPEECKNLWGDDMIHDMHVCVHESGKSACTGDSGGPVTCYQNGISVLGGVTSWGASSCSGDLPSVYARISYAREWISSVTGVY